MVRQAQGHDRGEEMKIVCRVEARRGIHYALVYKNGSVHESLVFSHLRLQQAIRKYHEVGFRTQFTFEYFYR